MFNFSEKVIVNYNEIKEDLKNFQLLGVDVYSVTCDGHNSILKAVKEVYPNAVIQICLVHVKRQIKSYLGSSPKLEEGKQLLAISKQITHLKTIEAAHLWLVL